MKKAIIYIIVFILIGEVMIRLDKQFLFLEENRVVKMATNIKITEEYKLLKNNNLPDRNTYKRIMVIGDSYIHGGGIEFKNNFSQQLKKIYNIETTNSSQALVLDISKPSSNSLDNNLSYFEYVNDFKPHIVILGYNINDIEGNLEKKRNSITKKIQGGQNQSLVSKIYSTIKKSEFIGYIMNKSHRKLNHYGIIIPGSKFDQNIKSYYQNKDSWIKTKKLLEEIIQDVNKRKESKLFIYKFQNTSVSPDLMLEANKAIDIFFDSYNTELTYLDGNDFFKEENYDKYRLSKYDGHPNEKAHRKMAEIFYDIIAKDSIRDLK